MTEEWIRRQREEALADPVGRKLLGLLAPEGMSIPEVRVALHERFACDLSLAEVNRHLAELQSVDLVWAENGRYWRVLR